MNKSTITELGMEMNCRSNYDIHINDNELLKSLKQELNDLTDYGIIKTICQFGHLIEPYDITINTPYGQVTSARCHYYSKRVGLLVVTINTSPAFGIPVYGSEKSGSLEFEELDKCRISIEGLNINDAILICYNIAKKLISIGEELHKTGEIRNENKT